MVRSTLLGFAGDGAALALAVRSIEKARALIPELERAGAPVVHLLAFDAAVDEAPEAMIEAAESALGGLDAVLVAHGSLVDQIDLETDLALQERSIRVNGTSAVRVLIAAARHFETQGFGTLAGITSGAGERGRRSTYGYGMGKGMMTACLSGLRARLQVKGIPVLTIFPCFVDTPMTAPLPKKMRWITPRDAGEKIHRAMKRGQDTLYVPGWWRFALFAARNTPEWIWKRMRAEEKLAAGLRAKRDSTPRD
ncbi:short chain dehydrogenase [Planctomycetes bacterium Poly30]|uniref:Short chain dehydrogenase n=2 Tax=Saltatorellus ferox TaxID=2528018 RepID=A0A518EZW4_9BACT|nr:short chain dehydrogenase [Planctomycetes bacterium Poly30]